ncbi:MAG: hypothetical protein ACPLRJ_01755 [Infirmifilum uzonense]|jgi:hypothetical protein|uniref:Restriction endonuclease type IV Mrr domain-containing protein n=1 Tax=Infirmifilum uzonense TaxID=1550241 RepID=A0A0F7FIR8_9CREN|nr:hypothetical protein [Infirmifilum uzonense]AKG38732.1 hypothetical protein MA03_04820 [Infirmifilum uzonense]
MTLARVRYLQKQLIKRYGIIGKVASRYLEAGLSVRIRHPTRLGDAHIIVQGNGNRLVVEVYTSPKPLHPRDVQAVAEKAKLLNSKPVIVIYSGGRLKSRVTKEALEEATRLQVKIKRV